MIHGVQFLAFLVAVVLIANVLARRRKTARRTTAADFALQRGLVPTADENPLHGVYVPLPPPPGFGLSATRPDVLEAISSGLGTVRNAHRGTTAAGEVFLLEHRMPPEGGRSGRHLFATWTAFRVPGVSTFRLIPRPLFAIGLKAVVLDGAPGMSRRFAILSADEGELRRAFTPAVQAACEGLPARKAWQISAGGGWVLTTFGLAEQGDLGVLLDASARVAAALQASCRPAAVTA